MNPWLRLELMRDRQAELRATAARAALLGDGRRRSRRRARVGLWRRRRHGTGGYRLTAPGGPTEGLWT